MNKQTKIKLWKKAYIEYMFILASTVTGCVSIFDFPYLVDIPVGIANSAVGFEICAIISGFKKYKSIIKGKKRKKHNKIGFLTKTKLNSIKVLTFKA